MKKNIIAAIAVASAFILSVSCQKQEISVSENTNDSEIVAFSATIDQESTKTVLAAGSANNKFKVNWELTDKITIKGAEYTASIIQTDATKATFSGNGATKEDNKYKAIYPSSLYKTDHFELPSIQTYAAGKFNAPMYAESETESLAFKNICGVLCLSLKGDSNDKIKYITVIANEGVCGKFTMGNDAATLNLSSTAGEYSRTVSLDCGEGVQLDNTTAKDFYINLPPNTYTAGMKIIITTTDSKVFEKITTASATIERNNIYTFDNWTLDFQPKPALLSGVFTVADGKTVQFTKGNLWADGSNALHFEDGQWNGVPSGSSKDESHIFHFTRSDNVTGAVGNDNSGTYLFCNESHKQTVDTQAGCYALSKDEWCHLFNGRTNATDKYGYATVNNVNGIIILPDTFNDPYAGIKVFTPSSTTEWAANEYSEAGWIAMEAAGAAFLPAAGHREGSNIITNEGYYGNMGRYWSSSSIQNEKYPYLVSFYKSGVTPDGYIDHTYKWGCSLRLVKDVPAATKGTAKRTGDIDVNWVRLWAGGPKFAEYNVGAENNKAEDYGGYYTWGGTDKNGEGIPWSDDHNTTNDGSGNLSSTDDTATKLWGSNWRMPTQTELDELLSNCDVEDVFDPSDDTKLLGTKFTGKGAYASNSVFLPAAGYCYDGDVSGQGNYGDYWSSTPEGSDRAYYLYFDSGSRDVDGYYYRNDGYSVRAVLAE